MTIHALPHALDDRPAGELLRRYDRTGPRYTSYPTAVEFRDGFTEARYLELVDEARGSSAFSLYVHLPFCESRCHFCGCNVVASPRRDVGASYLQLLEREIALVAQRLGGVPRFAQLHLGGGTPTFHSPEELLELTRTIDARFERTTGAELAIEVDPRVTTDAHVDALAGVGFNRMSLGVQDLSADVQDAIGRVQTREQTARVIDRARRRGIRGINVDLVYGLPRQTPASFAATLDSVLELEPDRAAVYGFAHLPDGGRGNQRRIEPGDVPGRDERIELFCLARERFADAGYVAIGMDHFARPDDELAIALATGELRRNFQGYTTVPAVDVLGFGVSSIGDVSGAYVQNTKKLSRYREQLEAGRLPIERGVERSADDEIRRAVIESLMCNFEIDRRAIERRFAIDFSSYFANDLAELCELEDEGLVDVGPTRITATRAGELLVRNLAMCFDAYRRSGTRDANRFSRTV